MSQVVAVPVKVQQGFRRERKGQRQVGTDAAAEEHARPEDAIAAGRE